MFCLSFQRRLLLLILLFLRVRATLLAALAIIPMTKTWHIRLGIWSDRIGGIISWEPFFICVAGLLIALDLEQEIGSNFTVSLSFVLMPTFTILITAWIVLTGFNSLAWKKVLQRYDPFHTFAEGDRGGPYCSCDNEFCFCFHPNLTKNVHD